MTLAGPYPSGAGVGSSTKNGRPDSKRLRRVRREGLDKAVVPRSAALTLLIVRPSYGCSVISHDPPAPGSPAVDIPPTLR